MPRMSETVKDLWRAVLADPEDDAVKWVLVDALAAEGNDPGLERGLRWCATKHRWPNGLPGYWWWLFDYCRFRHCLCRRAYVPAAISCRMCKLHDYEYGVPRTSWSGVAPLIRRVGIALISLENERGKR